MCEACASLKTFSADCVLGDESSAVGQTDTSFADLLASSGTNATVTVGGSYVGELETSGDSDWIAVNLVAGQTYTISLSGYGDTPVSDTYLRLFAPGSQDRATGTQVAYDDDGGAGYYSSLVYTATTTGTFYIDAASYADYYSGGYIVEVGGYEAPDNTQVWSSQQIADQLTMGYWGGTQRSFNVGSDNAITYNLTALDATYAGFARQALQVWSDIIGVQFIETTGSGEITFTQNGSMEAWSSSSRSGTRITGSTVNIASDWLTSQKAPYTQQTFIHEIGHALGLGHAGNYNGSASYGTDNLYANDSWQATVMSYFSQTQNSAIVASKAYLLTPMLADIVAIRDLYGTQGTTRTGDTVYGYNNNTGSSNFGANILNDSGTNYALTIVDDGGYDTIDMSGSAKNNRIDLTPGSISDTGGLTGNLTIGPDTIIESVMGGSGNDTITGNDADNVLFGNGGNDTLNGGRGEDFLDGGTGSDQIHGDEGDDTIIYDAADNWAAGAVTGGAGYDTLVFEPGTFAAGVWSTLNLVQNGFERYALVTYDSGSEAWREIDDYYNTSNQHIERTTYFDDGTSEYIRYDYDGTETWSEWVQTYDANGNMTGETFVSDVTQLQLSIGGSLTPVDIGSFVSQDAGDAEISDNGSTITLSNNAWKTLEIPTTITANTVISFDFKADVAGEGLGIGFDTDDTLSTKWLFQLAGSQLPIGLLDYYGLYTTGDGYVHYEIPVGQFFTGEFTQIVLAGDDDAGAGANPSFRNISIFNTEGLTIVDNETPLAFGVGSFLSQDAGDADISVDGTTITLSNNAWKTLDIDKTITANTVLSFDFKTDVAGEVLGIGFDTDNNLSTEWLFQLGGSQTPLGIQDFNQLYTVGDGYVHYEIPVGHFYTGDFSKLVFAGDDDAGTGANPSFSNIQLFETTSLSIMNNGDSNAINVMSYESQDEGTADISADGSTITLTDNAWKALDLTQTITANTVLSFDLKADVVGEVLGIGFDTDDNLSAEWLFQLAGTQKPLGLQDYYGQYTAGDGWVHYEIAVGQFFTGDFSRLVLAGDDDAGTGADPSFRNIALTEVQSLAVDDNSSVKPVGLTSFKSQDEGRATVSEDGTEITLSDNAWKALEYDKTITADTILSFDFKTDVAGEILGIGFDIDDNLSNEWFFQLAGSQKPVGIQSYNGDYTVGDGYVHYEIAVGDYFTGDFTRIVLAGDDDAGSGANPTFANISFYEASAQDPLAASQDLLLM